MKEKKKNEKGKKQSEDSDKDTSKEPDNAEGRLCRNTLNLSAVLNFNFVSNDLIFSELHSLELYTHLCYRGFRAEIIK